MPSDSITTSERNTATSSKLSGLRDIAGVRIPRIGTVLRWCEPSVFNAASIRDVSSSGESTRTIGSHVQSRRPHLQVLDFKSDEGGRMLCCPRLGMALRLDERFKSSLQDVPTQVWKCTVVPENEERASSLKSSNNTVMVLKLFTDQNDKLPNSIRVPREDYEKEDWDKPHLGESAQMSLSREADTFEALASLQGYCVPFSYGFYAFELPCGTSVVGHLQEFVPSVDILSYYSEVVKPDTSLINIFFTGIVEALIECHKYDISHQDPAIENLRLLPTSEPTGSFDFVFIDWTAASSMSYSKVIDAEWQNCESGYLEELLEDLDQVASRQWAKSKQGRQLWKLVEMESDQLVACFNATGR